MKKQIACPVCEGRCYVLWVNSTEDSCSSGSKTCPHCEGTGLREATMTNADRIRAMSNEKLVEFMESVAVAGCPCPSRNCRASCSACIMDWLKEPAEVDDAV